MQVPRKDGGFALLVVLMMSAGVAIMLYRELPRVAFESMRAKEEMLIERGEQYQRAVQLYVNKIKQYPQSMDDLDKGTSQKFLRRRYKDPFTGKDDWTLLKVDAAGVITNSKIKKKDEKKPNQNTFITEYAGIGETQNTGGVQGASIAMRRRPSDGPAPDPNSQGAPLPLPETEPPPPPPPPSGADQGQVQQPQQQLGQPGQPGAPMGAQGQQPQPGQPQFGQPQFGQQQFGQPPQPGTPPNLPPGMPQGISPQQMQQMYPNGVPNQPGAVTGGNQTYPTNAATQTAPPNAARMIMDALTKPSPNIPMNMGVGSNIGPGIVGVASKREGKAIKIYNEQEEYDKWEFVYDPRKDKRLMGALAGAMPQNQQPANLPGGPMGSSGGNANMPGPVTGFGPGAGTNAPTQPGGFGQPANRTPSGPAPIGSGYPPAIGSGYGNPPGQPTPQPQQPTRQQPQRPQQPQGPQQPQLPGQQPFPQPGNRR